MYYAIIVLLTAIDQALKYLVGSNMKVGESIPLIGNIVHITYVKNSGGAFSILQAQTGLLTVVSIALTAVIIVYLYIKRSSGGISLRLSLSLICAGGLGNLIDRIRLGAVTDFIDFRVFPIFNFADMCVCCGCGLLFIYMIILDRRGKAEDVSAE